MPPTGYPETNQWLMAEDEALKGLLSGLTVAGDKDGRTVPVYFRFPEQERTIIYPFITIDLLGIEPAYDLWMSEWQYDENEVTFYDNYEKLGTGLYEPSVSDSIWTVPGTSLDPSKPFRREHYLAYRLFYQVTTWSRTFAHDRALTSILMRRKLHPRPAWIRVPADSTWRRLEVLSWQPTDMPTQEGNIKRIFRKAFTISIQTEITQDDLDTIEQSTAVRRVAMRGFYLDNPDTNWTEDESHIAPGDKGWEVIAEE